MRQASLLHILLGQNLLVVYRGFYGLQSNYKAYL